MVYIYTQLLYNFLKVYYYKSNYSSHYDNLAKNLLVIRQRGYSGQRF